MDGKARLRIAYRNKKERWSQTENQKILWGKKTIKLQKNKYALKWRKEILTKEIIISIERGRNDEKDEI